MSVKPVRLFVRDGADVFSESAGTKARKPDLECGAVMTIDGAPCAVFFGSGSTPARMRAAIVTEGHAGPILVRGADVTSLYVAAREALDISEDALNLEAACVVGSVVRFFQRGNAGASADCVNASFDVDAMELARTLLGVESVMANRIANVRRYTLGELGGAPLGFSAAAALDDGRVVFAASAEASPNTYDDGQCAGSVLGLIGANQEIDAMWSVDAAGDPKIEGVAIESIDADVATVCAVTDPDDPSLSADLLRFRLIL